MPAAVQRLALIAAVAMLALPLRGAFARRVEAVAARSMTRVEAKPFAQDVPCEGTPKRHDNGNLKRCRLASDHRFGQHRLPAGTQVEFAPSGQLEIAVLAREAIIYGQPLPARATLFFGPDTKLLHFWLHEETLLQGHRVASKEDGVGHMLYPNGTLRAIWLAEPEVVQGVPCARSLPFGQGWWHAIRLGAQAMTWFYDDGRLQQAMLSRNITIQGRPLKRGDVIKLNRDGTLDLTSPKLDWQGWRAFPKD